MKGIQCDRCKKMYPRNYNVWREESGKAHPVVHLAKITVDKLVVDKVDLCDQCQKDFDRFINEYEQWNMRKDDRENRETTVEEYEQLAMDASDGEDNTGWETVNKSFAEIRQKRESYFDHMHIEDDIADGYDLVDRENEKEDNNA